MSWKLAGTYVGGCNCETVYPCVFLSPPPQGHCAVAIGWHIKEGESAGVNLDDSIVSLAVASPGKMHEVEWTAALYTDSRASKKQCGEEVKTFGGQAGRHSATLASYIGTLLGVAQGDIDSQQNGKSFSLKIPAMVDMDIKAIDGQRGGDCILEGILSSLLPVREPSWLGPPSSSARITVSREAKQRRATSLLNSGTRPERQ